MMLTRIAFPPQAPQTPWRYLLVEPTGRVLERGDLRPAASPSTPAFRDILVAPGADVAACWLRLPTRNLGQARAAARLQLGERIALSGEDVHLAVGAPEDEGWRLVCMVARDRMQAWLGEAEAFGLTPQAVIPDHLVPPVPGEDDGLVGAAFDGMIAVRGPRLAMTLEPDLAPVVLGGRDVAVVQDRVEIEGWLARAAATPAIDLLQGEFDPRRHDRFDWRNFKRAAVLAMALLVSMPLLAGARAIGLNIAAERLEARTIATAANVLPKGQPVTDPLGQTDARLIQLQLAEGGGPAGVIARLLTVLETIDQAQLEGLIVLPDGSIRANISYGQISDIELMRGAMRRDGVALRDESTEQDGSRVISEIILGVAP